MNKLKYIFGSLFLLTSAPVLADPAMPDTVIDDGGMINTVWVAGDYQVVADTFNSIGMLFNGGHDSIFWSLMFLAAIISLTVAITRLAFGGKMGDIGQWLMATIIMSMLFLPRTDVKVASYYTGSSGNEAGAVAFRKVDNIPIGIVYPLALTTNIGKKITELFDQSFQVLPNALTSTSADAANSYSFMVKGQEGFFSPLKLALRVSNRYFPSDPYFSTNLNRAFLACNWRDRGADFSKYGSFGLLMPESVSANTGLTDWTYKNSDGTETTIRQSCDTVGFLLSAQVLSDFAPSADGSSYVSKVLASSRDMNVLTKGSPDPKYSQNADKIMETESSIAPALIASAIGANQSNSLTAPSINTFISNAIQTGNTPEAMRNFIANREVTATHIKASMAFNNIIVKCLGSKDQHSCGQYASIMYDAGQDALIQSAGEASMFQRFSTGTSNLLLVVYIAMSPIIMFMIMVSGAKGIKLALSYLMFCTWIASWLPLTNVIASYMLKNYIINLEAIGAAVRSDPARALSPVFIENIMSSTSDMIASASSMMAYAPTIMLTLLSGSIYGMVALAQRASMTGKDFIKEEKAQPNLETSPAMGMSSRYNQQFNEGGGLVNSGGHLYSGHTMTNSEQNGTTSVNLGYSETEKNALQQDAVTKQSAADSIKAGHVLTTTYSHGEQAGHGMVIAKMHSGGYQAMTTSQLMKTEGVSEVYSANVGASGSFIASAGFEVKDMSQLDVKGSDGSTSAERIERAIQNGTTNSLQINGSYLESDSVSKAVEQMRSESSETAQRATHALESANSIQSNTVLTDSDATGMVASYMNSHGGTPDSVRTAMVTAASQEGARPEFTQALKSANSPMEFAKTAIAEASNPNISGVERNAALQALKPIVAENPNYQSTYNALVARDTVSDQGPQENIASAVNSRISSVSNDINGTNVDTTHQQFKTASANSDVANRYVGERVATTQQEAMADSSLHNHSNNIAKKDFNLVDDRVRVTARNASADIQNTISSDGNSISQNYKSHEMEAVKAAQTKVPEAAKVEPVFTSGAPLQVASYERTEAEHKYGEERAMTQQRLTTNSIAEERLSNNPLLQNSNTAKSLGKSVPVAQNVNSVAGIVGGAVSETFFAAQRSSLMNHSIPNAGHPQSAAPSLDSATPSFGHMHQSHNFSPLPKGSYSKPSTSKNQGIAVDMATSNSFTSGFEQSEQIMIQKKGKTLSGACAEGVRIGIEKSFHTKIGSQGHANQVIGNMVNNGTAKKLGYTEISFDPKTYVPREGDIMSMSKTSARLGKKFGHIGAYTKNGWYADGKQNKSFGNTIAFKQGDWEKIQRGEITVRVLRLGKGIGNSVLNVTGLKGATRKKG